MPLIKNGEILRLIELFNQRGVKLHHACQLKDFKAYIQLGGVPSRNLMESSKSSFTKFDTDEIDQKNVVWTKVFANLSDFGRNFARLGGEEFKAVPNPYGPIQLLFAPEALNESTDVAICLRSAGANDFHREKESLGSVDDVIRIFAYEEYSDDWKKPLVKFRPALIKEFDFEKATSPEVSCTIPDEVISFKYLSGMIVDPYVGREHSLINIVKTITEENKFHISPTKRSYVPDRFNIFTEINTLFQNEISELESIVKREETSDELKSWLNRVIENGSDYNFRRYAKYLIEGTISELDQKAA